MLQKKPCTQSIMQKYNRGKQLEKQQQMKRKKKQEEQQEEQQEDTEDSGESGDDKCMVCGEKEEDDVDIEDWVACEMCSPLQSSILYITCRLSLLYLFTVVIFIEY